MNTHSHTRTRSLLLLAGLCVTTSVALSVRAQLVQSESGAIVDLSESQMSSESGAIIVEPVVIDGSGASASSVDASESSAESSVSSEETSVASSSESSESSESVSSVESMTSSSAASSEEVSSSEAQSSASSSESSSSSSVTAALAQEALLGAPSNIAPAFTMPKLATVASADDLQERLVVTMTNDHGDEQTVNVDVTETRAEYRVTVEPPSTIIPGTYMLRAVLLPARGAERRNETTEETELINTSVEWGTVAFNPDRSFYAAGTGAQITFAPLEGTKTPGCVESLFATVHDETHEKQPTCDGVIATSVTTRENDTAYTLEATGSGSPWIMRDVLPVNTGASLLNIRRVSLPSVVLGREQTVEITVTAERGFRGSLEEIVPPGFEVIDVEPQATIDEYGDGGTTITWEREWFAGVPKTVRYTYRAPAEAPMLALFGPIKARGVTTEEQQPVIQEESSEASSMSSVSSSEESSASSDATIVPDEVSSSSEENIVPALPEEENSDSSLLGSLLRMVASLIVDGDNISFDEDRQMQVLVVASAETSTLDSSTFELTPLKTQFEAKESATFRLFANVSPETDDAAGSVSEQVGLSTIVEQLADADDLRTAVIAAIVEQEQGNIAEAFSRDSESANELGQAIGMDGSLRRLMTNVESHVQQEVEANGALRQQLAEIAQQDAAVQTLADSIVTDDVRKDIADTVAAGGDAADVIADIVDERAYELPTAVVNAVAETPEAVHAVATALANDSPEETSSSEPIIHVTLMDRNGTVTEPAYHFKRGSLILALDPQPAFTPGLYTVTVSVTNPLTGESQTLEQDFAWGVLAINPDADAYEPGDVAELAFGVLDDEGKIVCDADLTLVVTAPDGTTQTLTTEGGAIETTESCGIKEAGLIDPDYRASLTLLQKGEYRLSLTASIEAGARSMETTILVSDEMPFHITRNAATRLWPLAPSGMDIGVRFGVDVEGSVVETLPAGFTVTSVKPAADVSTLDDGTTQIRWIGSWDAGESATFHYDYDAPDISPQFYLLGPLKIHSELPIPLPQQ